MAESSAQRQRRFRRHKAGDHSLCVTGRCADLGGVTRNAPAVTPVPPDERAVERSVDDFGPRGTRLWSQLGGDALDGGRRVLAEEACRISDRLDRLDALLSGDARDWVELVETKGDPDRQEVVVDKLLSEARQQAVALKQLVAELRQTSRASGQTVVKGAAGVADLSARIAARRGQAAG